MNICIRCEDMFEPRYPKSKICKGCSRRGMPRGEGHWNYKDGSYTYETIRKELKETLRYCNRCKKDLLEATHYFWAVHHINHDHYDNRPENLELLCKSCHQIEHDCHKAFESVTTIPKGSTPEANAGGSA